MNGRLYSRRELEDSARQVAGWLESRSASTDRPARVGILSSRRFETYAGILGAFWVGATYVPLNPTQPTDRLRSILQRAGLDALVVDERGLRHLEALVSVLPRGVLLGAGLKTEFAPERVTPWEALTGFAGPEAPRKTASSWPAYILFTSGTTGVPKGVVVSVGALDHLRSCMRTQYGFGPEEQFAQFAETSFDTSVFDLTSCWDAGGCLHVVPEGLVIAPAGFIREHGITVWMSAPSVIQMLSQMKMLQPGSLPSLRASIFGGEHLSIDAARKWQAAASNSTVDNQYGPTETTVACSVQRLAEPPAETPDRGTLAIGHPFGSMTCAVVGPDGAFLARGCRGELGVSGPQLAIGYLDDPEWTAARFPTLVHPALGRSRWYLTGDLAVEDELGRFHCLGRVDNQVKVLGNRVELDEVEAHLRAVVGSEAVAALAWPVVNGNASGIVAFVCAPGVKAIEVRDSLRSRVPPYMVPARVIVLDSLPLSANRKVDRHALRSLLEHERR